MADGSVPHSSMNMRMTYRIESSECLGHMRNPHNEPSSEHSRKTGLVYSHVVV